MFLADLRCLSKGMEKLMFKNNHIDIQSVTVVGGGLMGHGIAQDFATSGIPVNLWDTSEEKLILSIENIKKNMGFLGQDHLIEDVIKLIVPISSFEEAVSGTDLVMEVIKEDLPTKLDLFKKIEKIVPDEVILASNTSTFIPSLFADVLRVPERMLITHYFNPPYIVPLVEVVKSRYTSGIVVNKVVDLLKFSKKTPVVLGKEIPGFVANRLQSALLRESISLVNSGVVNYQQVDQIVSNSFGRRLSLAGPFQISDAAGWDVISKIAQIVWLDLDNSQEPPKLIFDLINSGNLGIKTGSGIYDWDDKSSDDFKDLLLRGLIKMNQ